MVEPVEEPEIPEDEEFPEVSPKKTEKPAEHFVSSVKQMVCFQFVKSVVVLLQDQNLHLII